MYPYTLHNTMLSAHRSGNLNTAYQRCSVNGPVLSPVLDNWVCLPPAVANLSAHTQRMKLKMHLILQAGSRILSKQTYKNFVINLTKIVSKKIKVSNRALVPLNVSIWCIGRLQNILPLTFVKPALNRSLRTAQWIEGGGLFQVGANDRPYRDRDSPACVKSGARKGRPKGSKSKMIGKVAGLGGWQCCIIAWRTE